MTQSLATALLAGAVLGVGLWSLLAAVPRFGRIGLSDRIAPYLVDVLPAARERVDRRSVDPLPVFGLALAPALRLLRALIESLGGRPESIERRLRQAGAHHGIAGFRARQLVSTLFGAGIGGTLGVIAVAARSTPWPVATALAVIGAVGGLLVADRMLQRAVRRRLVSIDEELPTMLEFLALSLSAGESMLDALQRAAKVSSGVLGGELATTVAEVAAGVPLMDALERAAAGLQSPGFSRLVAQLRSAIDRGTPLAEVLHAQAEDARAAAGRALLESAGRKEIAMLVPVVFLILPTTVVFAVFPGIAVLRLGF